MSLWTDYYVLLEWIDLLGCSLRPSFHCRRLPCIRVQSECHSTLWTQVCVLPVWSRVCPVSGRMTCPSKLTTNCWSLLRFKSRRGTSWSQILSKHSCKCSENASAYSWKGLSQGKTLSHKSPSAPRCEAYQCGHQVESWIIQQIHCPYLMYLDEVL